MVENARQGVGFPALAERPTPQIGDVSLRECPRFSGPSQPLKGPQILGSTAFHPPLRSGPKPCPKRNLRAHWIRLSVERTRLSVGERRSRRRATRRGTAGTASRARSSLASGDSFARARPTQRVPSCRCVIFRQPQPLQRPRRSASAPRLPRSSTRGRGRSRLRSGPRSCADSQSLFCANSRTSRRRRSSQRRGRTLSRRVGARREPWPRVCATPCFAREGTWTNVRGCAMRWR